MVPVVKEVWDQEETAFEPFDTDSHGREGGLQLTVGQSLSMIRIITHERNLQFQRSSVDYTSKIPEEMVFTILHPFFCRRG